MGSPGRDWGLRDCQGSGDPEPIRRLCLLRRLSAPSILVRGGLALERVRRRRTSPVLAQGGRQLDAARIRSLGSARATPPGDSRQLARGGRILPIRRTAAAHRARVGSGLGRDGGQSRQARARETAISLGKRAAQRPPRESGWPLARLRGRRCLPRGRQRLWLPPDDRQRLGMDRQRIQSLPGICRGSLPGLFQAMVRNAQSLARRLLVHPGQADSQYLAQLLHGGSTRHTGRLQNVRALSICLVSTTPSDSRKGNRVTAVRWSRLLRELGHRVRIEQQYRGGPCDLLIALHARRSFPSVERFRKKYPERPLVVALTGTDLYRDIRVNATAREAVRRATRLVVLQPLGLAELARPLRRKTRVIVQSVERPPVKPALRTDAFEVCVLGHLRPVKDPFRAAEAVRRLPTASRIRILQVGGALSPSMKARASREQRVNPRYRWLGELPRGKALRLMGRCRLLVLTSLMEGGANAISEALAWGVPILASRIPGSVGLLGARYPGYFEPGDTAGLRRLLLRAETSSKFLQNLRRDCARLAPKVEPRRERAAWAKLLREIR